MGLMSTLTRVGLRIAPPVAARGLVARVGKEHCAIKADWQGKNIEILPQGIHTYNPVKYTICYYPHQEELFFPDLVRVEAQGNVYTLRARVSLKLDSTERLFTQNISPDAIRAIASKAFLQLYSIRTCGPHTYKEAAIDRSPQTTESWLKMYMGPEIYATGYSASCVSLYPEWRKKTVGDLFISSDPNC